MTAPARIGARTQFSNGPWKSVRNTPDPFNNAPDQLVAATNAYIPDPDNGSAVYGRPGYVLMNPTSPLAGAGQCVFKHVDATGGVYNFIIAGGKVYLASDNCTIYTDVTPSGVMISSTAHRVYMVTFNGFLVVSDGVNRPWVATNLSGSPITGTYISFDGTGSGWRAFGKPVVYAGSLIFMLLTDTTGVYCRSDIAWSAPGDPTTGYEQGTYDFRWTLQQTGSDALHGLCGTNLALYYWRPFAIGALTGTPATAGSVDGSDFRNSSTHDSIAANVGCLESDTIVQYGSNIFFTDAHGKPWMLPTGPWQQQVGANLVPIWESMRGILEASAATEPLGDPYSDSDVFTASIETQLGLYIVANIKNTDVDLFPPGQVAVFDGRTAAYEGQWFIGDGTSIESQGSLEITEQNLVHVIVGSKTTPLPATGGYIWMRVQGAQFWQDYDGTTRTIPAISVTTPRFGFSANTVQNVDKVTAIEGSSMPLQITLSTPLTSQSVVATPLASTDSTYRVVGGFDIMGRGVTVNVQPQNSGPQFALQQVVAAGVSSMAGADDA